MRNVLIAPPIRPSDAWWSRPRRPTRRGTIHCPPTVTVLADSATSRPARTIRWLINRPASIPVASAVTSSGNNFNCTDGSGSSCNFQLSHGYLAGTLQLASASSSPLSAMVMAEDSGTSNVENFAQVIVPPSQRRLPTSACRSRITRAAVSIFSPQFRTILMASRSCRACIRAQQNTGHSIAVEAGVGHPAPVPL